MSNPLAAFRKYQQALLVIFGIMLMIVFTVGGIVDQTTRSASESDTRNKPAVSWKDGKLSESALAVLRQNHNRSVDFVAAVMRKSFDEGATPRPLPLPVQDDDVSLTRTWIISEQARKEGVEITDQAIMAWLNRITENTLSAADFDELLRAVTGGRMKQASLFGALRMELRAIEARSMVNSGMFPSGPLPASPGVAWDLFNRLQRRLKVEMLPVKVDDYLEQAGTPSSEQITELYERYKDQTPNPISPEPGFRRPLRRAFQYVRLDTLAALEAEMAKVTPAEVQEYYNQHLDDFRELELPGEASTTGETTGESESPEVEDDTSIDELLNELDLGSPSDSPQDAPASESDPTESETGNAAEEPTAETSEQDEATDSDPGCGDEAEESEDPAAEDETDSGTDSAEQPQAAAEEARAEEAGESSETGPTEPSAGDLDALEGLLDEQTPKYRPLKEVEEQIRNAIAGPRLVDQMNASMSKIQTTMGAYSDEYRKWVIAQEIGNEMAEPPAPDIQQVASDLGLSLQSVNLSSAQELVDHELGRLTKSISTQDGLRRVGFLQEAFSDSIQLRRPVRFGNDMVYWATEEAKENVPSLKECREEVVHAWQRERALEPARKAAEEMAAKARDANTSLAETFSAAEYDVFQPDSENGISWMTPSSVPVAQGGGVFLSQLPQVEYAGPDTMQQIFRLKPGEFGVAVNHPKSIVYVVHVLEETTTDAQRHNRFMPSVLSGYLTRLNEQERQLALARHFEKLEDDLDLRWHRTPTNPSRRR